MIKINFGRSIKELIKNKVSNLPEILEKPPMKKSNWFLLPWKASLIEVL